MTKVILEVCVDDAAGLDAAIAGGADRIELCAALDLGGLTPAPGLIRRAAQAPVPVYAMVRPHAGHFVYDEADLDTMLSDIDFIRDAGLAGVVMGASLRGGGLDVKTLERLVERAAGLGKTLHRAFDLVPDFAQAVEIAASLGFERILTSGGAPSAIAGAHGLQTAYAAACGRLSIMPGGGVNAGNLSQLLSLADFTEVHSSCSIIIPATDTRAFTFGFEAANHRQTSADSVATLKALLPTR
jgi:copper homeostasis protein